MRPKIKLREVTPTPTRPRIVIRTPINYRSQLAQLLRTQTNPKQVYTVTCLLQRYGVARVRDLPPDRVKPFTAELQGILAKELPHPADGWPTSTFYHDKIYPKEN